MSGDSSDLDFTVVYTKNAPTKPVDPSQPTTPTKPVNPSQPTTPAKPVQAGQAAATNFVDQRSELSEHFIPVQTIDLNSAQTKMLKSYENVENVTH